jgi:DNA cross-link repair 1A protein
MKKWFEKWLAEKARRKEKNLPAVVDYRDITYVSASSLASTCPRLLS